MSRREIIAYAISHAPKGVKGGPYEGPLVIGRPVPTLAEAWRTHSRETLLWWLHVTRHTVPTARVIRIVRARPSSEATMETARRRLAAVAEHMTEHAYQEMASALDVDACRVGPSEASAVEVLRELVAWDDGRFGRRAPADDIFARARAVLAASGPDPMPVVRAAMEWRYGRRGDTGPMNTLAEAVETYRKDGGE